MPDPTSIEVLLHLESAAGTIKGTVQDCSGQRLPFYGWLELSSMLDHLRSPPPEAAALPANAAQQATDPDT